MPNKYTPLKSATKTTTWTLEEIVEAHDEKSRNEYHVQLPRFQRSLVWKPAQKELLIKSLYQGFPIGSLLVYQTQKIEKNRRIVTVVDGLQRITTILEYMESPLLYAPVEEFFSTELLEGIATVFKDNGSNNQAQSATEPGVDYIHTVTAKIREWLRECKRPVLGATYNTDNLIQYLVKGENLAADNLDHLKTDFNVTLGFIQKRVEAVASLSLPVLIYSGEEENLPGIFERMNSKGTVLSRYEILAATWFNAQTRIQNDEIKDAIAQKYKVLIERGYEIDNYNDSESIGDDEYNLFEYLFGLGQLLSSKYPLLFDSEIEADATSPVAFAIAATACQLPSAKLGSLPGALPKQDEIIIPKTLEDSIFEAAKLVNDALKPYLNFKLNGQSKATLGPHSQNQIVSFLTWVLVSLYDSKNGFSPRFTGAQFDQKKKELAKFIPAHYILDLLKSNWKGSGDSRLFNVTWDETQDQLVPSKFYSESVSKEQLGETLKSWHEDELLKKQFKRPSISAASKAVLMFVYSKLITVAEHEAFDFEIEHLYTIDFIKKKIEQGENQGWPMGALGNLALIPKDLNRIKGKFLLGDYLPDQIELFNAGNSDGSSPDEIKDIQRFVINPDWQLIVDSDDFDVTAFAEFCRDRFDQIAKILIKHVGLN